MSNAHENDVTRHFEKTKTPRLEISMLPRDVNRVTGTLRKVICTSFNYVRKYPVKMDKYIEVLKWACNFAMAYKHFQEESRLQQVEAESKRQEEEVVRLAAEERLAKQKAEKEGDE